MPKNIVICCDGTNNEIVGDQTNVLRLYRMLSQNERQIAFYDPGVGTKADPTALWWWKRRLLKTFDAAVGENIRANVLDAYRFLVRCYEPDDDIFLFGFSRGAYTVRALAGMLKRCGLLSTDGAHLAEYAWAVYSNEDHSADRSRMFGGSARIKKVFGRPVVIHFVGVWDTVSSFGWFYDQLTLPDTASNDRITHARHAVSIDERRAFFKPNLFWTTDAWPKEGQDCVQVWFAGVHADVGGGYPDKDAGLARLSLQWMLGEARSCGLRTEPVQETDMLNRLGSEGTPDALAPQHDESKKWLWWLGSLLPRVAYSKQRKGRIPRWPNLARARVLYEGALIHRSVETRMRDLSPRYNPKLPTQFSVIDDKGPPEEN
jgi:uncharacterized protein (DUF2235 family)